MSKPQFVYEISIAAPPQRVWEALTQSDFTRQYWSGRTIESDWKVGSRVRLSKPDGGHDWEGEVLEVDPPRRLVYTFACPAKPGEVAEPPSRVTLEIRASGGGVMLSVIHDNFPPESKILAGISRGWPGILTNMKQLLETGAATEKAGCGCS